MLQLGPFPKKKKIINIVNNVPHVNL